MFTQASMWKRYYVPFAGVLFACNFAMAQNWVSSGPSGAPVLPFDAIADGYVVSPTGVKTPLYTCRGGENEGYGLQIGRYTPGGTTCDFSYGGLEISVLDFQFLVTSWQAETGGVIPANAVVGNGSLGSPLAPPPLYICRGKVGEVSLQRPALGPVSLQLGEIGRGYAGCVVPYSGRGLLLGTYEVLAAETPAMPIGTSPESGGFVPPDAIHAGTDADGTPLYLCSAIYGGSSHPGKLHSSFGGCNISFEGVEHTVSSYFVPRVDWLGIPNYDFPSGTDSNGAPLHVCRAYLNGNLYPGKTQKSWKTCNFGLNGKEEMLTNYEILSN
jgi:hypothetical protein